MLFVAVDITYYMLLVAMGLTFVRLVRGPSLPDRVVALDLLAILAVAVIGVLAIRSHNESFVDAGIALAFIAFLSTVAFARYVDKSCEAEEETGEEDG